MATLDHLPLPEAVVAVAVPNRIDQIRPAYCTVSELGANTWAPDREGIGLLPHLQPGPHPPDGAGDVGAVIVGSRTSQTDMSSRRKQPIVPLGPHFASDKIGEIGNLEKQPSASPQPLRHRCP